MPFRWRRWGRLLIVLGVALLLGGILPSDVWPFLVGLLLIGLGACMLR